MELNLSVNASRTGFPSSNLSVCFADSSPGRGASGETVHFAGTAKASSFGRGVTEGDGEGKPGTKEAPRSDRQALCQSDTIAVSELFGSGLALSGAARQLSQRESLWSTRKEKITMQNIDLICVGKLNAKYFAEGVAEYQKRLAAFASFRIVELPEEKIEEKNASDAVVKKALDKEGRAILGSVRRGAAIVALCIEGKQISSEELAQFLADRANSGAGDVAFVIGSSHGLSDEVKRAAALRFSMGRITMPHQLARLVLTEQIYRACTINAGMKYHK